jgi:uncharacterized membrane protein (UPF0127 family)
MRFVQIALTAFLLAACAETSAALPIETITIDTHKGSTKLTVEVAADQKSQERGLMDRKALDPDAGMLFDFGRPQFVSFWMKDTYIPLDMIFVRADGTISTVEPNAIPLNTESIPSAEPVVAVIEINGGRARDLDIEPGDRVHASIFPTAQSPTRASH